MGSKEETRVRSSRLGGRAAVVVAFLSMFALVGCGDDDKSAQERYCEAGESLASSLGALTNLDLIAQGTDGLEEAAEEVQDDVDELRDAASDAAADDVAALEQSVDELENAISALGGDLTTENVATVSAAIQTVGTSAQAVFDTLSDC
mgnify:CR=1 FL=1